MNSEPFATSREAYTWCVEQGLISKRVEEVLQVLVDDGPMNQTMAHQAIIRKTGIVGLEKYSISPRFATLERMGLIRSIDSQACPITHRTTKFYEATNRRPICTEAEANNSAPRRALIKSLEAQVKDLTSQLGKATELLNMKSEAFKEREKRIKAEPVAVQGSLF